MKNLTALSMLVMLALSFSCQRDLQREEEDNYEQRDFGTGAIPSNLDGEPNSEINMEKTSED